MRRAFEPQRADGPATARMRGLGCTVALMVLLASQAAAPVWAATCDQPVYLTFDTGHMGVAELIADVLKRHDVKATFFLANEATREGGSSLDERWAPWWRARVAEGHVFGSHTWDHWIWRGDLAEGFRVQATAGREKGKTFNVTATDYCRQLLQPAQRFKEMTGQALSPIFRAPAGRTSPALLAAAQRCGFQHVGWAAAGFLGDELPSEKFSNAQLLQKALRDVRRGDILVAHLGIWSRREPWAPAVLEPLIVGLRQRGLCFATLGEHPHYRTALVAK